MNIFPIFPTGIGTDTSPYNSPEAPFSASPLSSLPPSTVSDFIQEIPAFSASPGSPPPTSEDIGSWDKSPSNFEIADQPRRKWVLGLTDKLAMDAHGQVLGKWWSKTTEEMRNIDYMTLARHCHIIWIMETTMGYKLPNNQRCSICREGDYECWKFVPEAFEELELVDDSCAKCRAYRTPCTIGKSPPYGVWYQEVTQRSERRFQEILPRPDFVSDRKICPNSADEEELARILAHDIHAIQSKVWEEKWERDETHRAKYAWS